MLSANLILRSQYFLKWKTDAKLEPVKMIIIPIAEIPFEIK